tara:strand:- start:150 stop:440 length:291 start_codon:yes stop_codon:yes gene_type:complete
MKTCKFTPKDPDSKLIVLLISASQKDKDTNVFDVIIHEAGVYIIELDDEMVGLEDLSEYFPLFDMSNATHREEAYKEYQSILTESEEYITIPEKLC